MTEYYNNLGDSDNKALENIKYIKGLYEVQSYNVKKEQHIENLLKEDYLRAIKSYKTRYDLLDNMFAKAQAQMNNKYKKDRPQFETLKELIMKDFFDNDKNFKITNIIQCGYDGYGYNVYCCGYNKDIMITFPVKDKLTISNMEYAHDGQISVAKRTSEHSWETMCSSYIVEDVAEAIRDYFDN